MDAHQWNWQGDAGLNRGQLRDFFQADLDRSGSPPITDLHLLEPTRLEGATRRHFGLAPTAPTPGSLRDKFSRRAFMELLGGSTDIREIVETKHAWFTASFWKSQRPMEQLVL